MSKRLEDYMIGIVCTLPLERAAIRAFLDSEHDPLLLPLPYRGIYALGSMCGHDVVVAYLSPGSVSTSALSADVIARDMIYVFKAIRSCLLVGIGGGIPSDTNDIRLGDVVVSAPSGGHGGVVQIDIGERHFGKPFERIGWLDSPPSALLQAVETLTSQDEIDGLELRRDILQMLEAHPRIRKHYRFPERNRDLLFRADYAHAQPGESCSSCDPSNLVARTVRYDQNPVVHHGTMALWLAAML